MDLAWQVPLSMGFSRQEYLSGLPCPPPGDLPYPGIELTFLMSPALAGGSFTISTTWETHIHTIVCKINNKILSSVKSLSQVQLSVTPWTAAPRLPCPSPTPRTYSNSSPSIWWCHPTISSSVVPFSSCLQYFPASGSPPMSQFFTSGGQSIGVSASASVLPINTQGWFHLGWTGWISLQSKGLSRVFSNTTVQKHQLLGLQVSL